MLLIRIFYDFWAYSLIAIGLAKLISLDLPINFREPYQSHSPREFWRRWHVTLSYWLRDYLYIRIGGNNNYVRNIVIVFLACGLWHGAGWSFVVWGALHGGGVLLYHFNRRRWDSWPAFVKISLTYALISLSWPLFFMDIDRYVTLLKVLVWSTDGAGIYTLKHWFFILPILAWMFFSKERVWLYNKKPIIIIDSPVIHSLMALIAIIFASYSDTFIYFRF